MRPGPGSAEAVGGRNGPARGAGKGGREAARPRQPSGRQRERASARGEALAAGTSETESKAGKGGVRRLPSRGSLAESCWKTWRYCTGFVHRSFKLTGLPVRHKGGGGCTQGCAEGTVPRRDCQGSHREREGLEGDENQRCISQLRDRQSKGCPGGHVLP